MGAVHVQGCEVGPGTAALIFVFDAHGAAGAGRYGGMGTATRLDARLLVGRDDQFVVAEGLAFPAPLVQIEDGCGLLREVGVAGKEPGPMLPGTNRVFGEPPPDRAATDGADQAGFLHVARELGPAPSRQGHAVRRRQLTGQSLDLHDDLRGEKPEAGPGGRGRRGPRAVAQRSACATWRPPLGDSSTARRSGRFAIRRRPGGSSGLARPGNTATYIFVHAAAAQPLHHHAAQCHTDSSSACQQGRPRVHDSIRIRCRIYRRQYLVSRLTNAFTEL